MNKFWLGGPLAADPEMGGGATPMARIRVVHEHYNSTTRTREPWFIPAVAFGKTAETLLKYAQKGKHVDLVCHIQPREYTDRDGNKRRENSIVVDELELGPSSAKSAGGSPARPAGEPLPWGPELGSTFADDGDDPLSFG